LHPDVYARSSGNEQDWSLQKTSQLNDAYPHVERIRLPERSICSRSKAPAGRAIEAATTSTAERRREEAGRPAGAAGRGLRAQHATAGTQDGQARSRDDRATGIVKKRFEQKLDESTAELKNYWNAWDSAKDSAAEKQAMDQMVALLNRRSYVRTWFGM